MTEPAQGPPLDLSKIWLLPDNGGTVFEHDSGIGEPTEDRYESTSIVIGNCIQTARWWMWEAARIREKANRYMDVIGGKALAFRFGEIVIDEARNKGD